MIDKNNNLKISDFVSARILKAKSTISTVGTTGYMPPEIEFNNKYDNKTDIWLLTWPFFHKFLFKRFLNFKRALGVIFHEMITFRFPFSPDDNLSKYPIPKLPQIYEEYNFLLQK